MNFKKLMIVVAVVVVFFTIYHFVTAVDRSNPIAVATAFTKALKKNDTSTASKFIVPDQSATWREQIDEQISGMKSGAELRYFERIPADPGYGAPVTAAGKTTVVSADKNFTLEMTQIDGKWYIAKSP